MPYTSAETKRTLTYFFIAIIGAIFFGMLPLKYFYTTDMSMFVWCGIIIAWVFSVNKRVIQRDLRIYIGLSAICMIALFVLRSLRYTISDVGLYPVTERMLRYSYYVPVVFLTILLMMAARQVIRYGKKPSFNDRLINISLIIYAVIMSVFVMTNDIHRLLFDYKYVDGEFKTNGYGVLFWIFVVTVSSLILVSFIKLLIYCYASASRKYMHIPIIVAVFCSLLFIIYFINGSSSPEIFGMRIYKLQDVYALLFLGLWESYIYIGIIPSNTDMDTVFSKPLSDYGITNGESIIVNSRGAQIKYDARLKEMKSLLKENGDFDANLFKAMLICAYVKRSLNLSIEAYENNTVSLSEFYFTLRESINLLNGQGIKAFVSNSGNEMINAGWILFTYDFFEEIIEQTLFDLKTLYVHYNTSEGFYFRILMECDKEVDLSFVNQKRLWALNGEMFTDKDSDGLVLGLKFKEGAA